MEMEDCGKIEKITARVFCFGHNGGGNPVTLFTCDNILSSSQREQLAQQCNWESVFVNLSLKIPQMSFYMPSDEQVSFCAHAAMGGSTLFRSTSRRGEWLSFTTAPMPSNADDILPSSTHSVIVEENGIVILQMETTWSEKQVLDSKLLDRVLKVHHNVNIADDDILATYTEKQPTFCNFSIARYKTLVKLSDVDASVAAPTAAINTSVTVMHSNRLVSIFTRNTQPNEDRGYV